MAWNKEDIEELVIKWLSGEASQDEVDLIQQAEREDPVIKKLIESYQDTWNLTAESGVLNKIDIESEWDQLRSSLNIEAESSQTESDKVIRMDTSDVGETGWRGFMRIAAVLFIIGVAAIALISYLNNPNERYLTTSETQIIDLPDGSIITANQNTLIKHPTNFKGDVREIYIEGEAYFEVEENPEKPFVVSTGTTSVTVLGTKFNVKAYYESDLITVTVYEGKVAFEANSVDSTIVLEKDDWAQYSKKDQRFITTLRKLNTNAISWKSGVIDFNEATLEEVSSVLESVYQVSVEVENDSVLECTITAEFKDQGLQSVLTVIEATLDIEYKLENNKLIISGEGC